MRLRWTPEAASDLEDISHYLRANHATWRNVTMQRIYHRAQLLRLYPFSGRKSTESEAFRQIMLTPLPYIMKYHVSEHAVTILQIRHGAQIVD